MPDDLDIFPGAEQLRALSARLADRRVPGVSDEEVAAALGAEVVAAFRYGQAALRGRVRRTTRERAFCHSADVALRAADLKYRAEVRRGAVLHDAVEDRVKSLTDVARLLDEVADRFGAETARDVQLLTNRYAIFIGSLRRCLPAHVPFEEDSLTLVRQAIDKQWAQVPETARRQLQDDFERTTQYFLPRVDLAAGAARAAVDPGYTLLAELKLQGYRPFVEAMGDDARTRTGPDGNGLHETVLVVKALDIIDNLRTSEIGSWAVLERILLKAEIFLDTTFYLHSYIYAHRLAGTTFIPLYDTVKHHLVEQLQERRHALSFVADSRFAPLVSFLAEELVRLQHKYKVEDVVTNLRRLRVEIRERNERRTM